MTRFRYSEHLAEKGIDYRLQGLIYFRLHNPERESAWFRGLVRHACSEAAGCDAQALYELLTDPRAEGVGICMKYHIQMKKLTALKNRAYEIIAKAMRRSPML